MDSALPPDPPAVFLRSPPAPSVASAWPPRRSCSSKAWQPSERARAGGGPVEVDLPGIAPGNLRTIEWRGRPVWVLHRTSAMLEMLGKHDNALVDPTSRQDQQPPYARNPTRSIRPSVAGRLSLSLPWFALRPGRPRVPERASAAQPRYPALRVHWRRQTDRRAGPRRQGRLNEKACMQLLAAALRCSPACFEARFARASKHEVLSH